MKDINQAVIHKHKKWKKAGAIKDRFPQVKNIAFSFLYQDDDNLMEPFSKTFIRYPEDSAYFEFDCPFRGCVDGGHDLSVLDVTIKELGYECTGKAYCEGWASKDQIGKHHCLCNLAYTITVTYL